MTVYLIHVIMEELVLTHIKIIPACALKVLLEKTAVKVCTFSCSWKCFDLGDTQLMVFHFVPIICRH